MYKQPAAPLQSYFRRKENMLEQDSEYPHTETLLARAHNQDDGGSKRNHS
jgi:hypothetical protein